MSPAQSPNDSLVISYLGLRKAIGIIGIALPLVLAIGANVLEGPGLEPSVSNYYYTEMRDVFVGSLCAIAVFMASYHGYERQDDIAGDFACIFALGVALLPTTPDADVTPQDSLVGVLHLVCAAGFFLTLAFFSLVLFRKTNPNLQPTPRKLQRNAVYMACGIIILACLALVAAVSFLSPESPVKQLQPVFWLESAAIMAFGVSWFVKGEAILKD